MAPPVVDPPELVPLLVPVEVPVLVPAAEEVPVELAPPPVVPDPEAVVVPALVAAAVVLEPVAPELEQPPTSAATAMLSVNAFMTALPPGVGILRSYARGFDCGARIRAPPPHTGASLLPSAKERGLHSIRTLTREPHMRSHFVGLAMTLLALACSSAAPSTCPEALCNGVCCADGGQCIANACCPAAQVCDSACCVSGMACVAGTGGTHSCGMLCQKGTDCPSATPCCSAMTGSAEGVCTNATSGCLCLASTECDGGECAPQVNASGVITGPYVCVANDGSAHNGCLDTSCQLTSQTCAVDLIGNQFCSTSCSHDSNCVNAGVACCNATCPGGHCCGLCGH